MEIFHDLERRGFAHPSKRADADHVAQRLSACGRR